MGFGFPSKQLLNFHGIGCYFYEFFNHPIQKEYLEFILLGTILQKF
jgi:hypothetical protein